MKKIESKDELELESINLAEEITDLMHDFSIGKLGLGESQKLHLLSFIVKTILTGGMEGQPDKYYDFVEKLAEKIRNYKG